MLQMIKTLSTSNTVSTIPPCDVTTFKTIAMPFLDICKKNKKAYKLENMASFIEKNSALSPEEFCSAIAHLFTRLDYNVTQLMNTTDLLVEKLGVTALVRTQAKAESLNNIMVRSIGVKECQQLKADFEKIKVDMGVFITAGSIYSHALTYCKSNKIFRLMGKDLMKLIP